MVVLLAIPLIHTHVPQRVSVTDCCPQDCGCLHALHRVHLVATAVAAPLSPGHSQQPGYRWAVQRAPWAACSARRSKNMVSRGAAAGWIGPPSSWMRTWMMRSRSEQTQISRLATAAQRSPPLSQLLFSSQTFKLSDFCGFVILILPNPFLRFCSFAKK